jgi:hypothetical protein
MGPVRPIDEIDTRASGCGRDAPRERPQAVTSPAHPPQMLWVKRAPPLDDKVE